MVGGIILNYGKIIMKKRLDLCGKYEGFKYNYLLYK